MSVQKRRSISVKGEVYERVHAYCKKAGISMSAFIEERIAVFFSGLEETSFTEDPEQEVSTESLKPQRKQSDEDNAIFTESVKPPVRKSSMSDEEIITEVRQHFTF